MKKAQRAATTEGSRRPAGGRVDADRLTRKPLGSGTGSSSCSCSTVVWLSWSGP
jgi:hypothetical protein